MNPAAEPVPQEDLYGDNRWMSLHEHYLVEAKEKEPDVLFVGASIIQQLAQTSPTRFSLQEEHKTRIKLIDMSMRPGLVYSLLKAYQVYHRLFQVLSVTDRKFGIWKQMFEPLHSLNFGIAGDQTQHVLWRLENGELDYLSPKVVVVNVGSNNHEHSAQQVAEAQLKIVDFINTKLPHTQIIIMVFNGLSAVEEGLTPRGHKPNALREKNIEVNSIVAKKLDEKPNAAMLLPDLDSFIDKDGLISVRDMYDFLHFTNEGYQKLCEPLLEEIQNLLKTFVKCESIDVEDI